MSQTKIIAIGSGKGGVGKSTVTANLAMALADLNYKVGIIDADLYGPTQSKIFGCMSKQAGFDDNNKIIPLESHGVKLISVSALVDTDKPLILRSPMIIKILRELLHNVNWGELDYLLIDLPPGTGDIQLSLIQNSKLDGAIVVTTPQEVAVNIAKKGLDMFRKLNVPVLGIIENMSGFKCGNCNELSHIFTEGNVNEFAKKLDIPIWAKIPLQTEISKAADLGEPLKKYIKSEDNYFTLLAKKL
tara:strand:+ start:235 stop:969 length:735 start_codon:yes stop_codon:yes gene_type:complete